MSQLRTIVVTLFACLASVNAVALSTTPAWYLPNGYDGRSITVGPAPVITAAPELRRRQSSGVQSNCGESDGTTNYCLNGKACAATIYENGNAYGYCSSPGASTQAFETSALADVSSSYAYPKCPGIHVACCTSGVITQLYVNGAYQVTFWACNSDAEDITQTWEAYDNLLSPASFSLSLVDAPPESTTPPSSSSSSSSSAAANGGTPTQTVTNTVTVGTSIKNGGPSSTAAGTSKHHGGGSGSGLSSSETIGIGAGIGGGVGALALAGLLFFLWRRHQKKKDRELAEVSAEISPAPAYSPPMSPMPYSQSFAEHDKQGPRREESYQSLGRFSPVSQGRFSPVSQRDQRASELDDDPRYSELAESRTTQGFPYELYGRGGSTVRRV